MRDLDVVVVGSLNMDLVARVTRLPAPGETVSGDGFAEFPGGKGLNQAVAAARSGARVAIVGAVGTDRAGAALREVVRTDGIDDEHLASIDEAVSGRAMIAVDATGENSIIVIAGANGQLAVDDVPRARVVLAQFETTHAAVEDAFRLARALGAITILDPAPARPVSGALSTLVDVLVPNEHELDLLGGVDSLAAAGIEHLVVTRGGAGTDLVSSRHGRLHLDPFPVRPVDTTGAGDAFRGSLAARLAAGEPLDRALRFAAAAGALATTRHGAVPSQPHQDAIRELMAEHPTIAPIRVGTRRD